MIALKIAVYFALILAVAKPLGVYMARLFTREKTYAIERAVYRLGGIDETKEQSWSAYTIAMLVFSGVTLLLTYAIERLQHVLPLNPDKLGAVAPDLVGFGRAAWREARVAASNASNHTHLAALTIADPPVALFTPTTI